MLQYSNTTKECQSCHRTMPLKYPEDLCPSCKEIELFSQVKDFIRSNDVNEYAVASHFNIPVRKVKEWIHEGRIEYRDVNEHNITSHCQVCGTKISFGSLCTKCLHSLTGSKKGHSVTNKEDLNNDGMFHYV